MLKNKQNLKATLSELFGVSASIQFSNFSKKTKRNYYSYIAGRKKANKDDFLSPTEWYFNQSCCNYEYTFDEIGETLGISKDEARRLYNCGIEKIINYLKENNQYDNLKDSFIKNQAKK